MIKVKYLSKYKQMFFPRFFIQAKKNLNDIFLYNRKSPCTNKKMEVKNLQKFSGKVPINRYSFE